MHTINRLITNLCSDHLVASRNFYTHLFDMEVAFDSDWYIQLTAKSSDLELGIIDRTHAIVPDGFRQSPQGMYLTFVVDDVDAVHQLAVNKGFTVVHPPTDTFYGQRRLLLQDPDGTLVDVSAPIPDFSFGA